MSFDHICFFLVLSVRPRCSVGNVLSTCVFHRFTKCDLEQNLFPFCYLDLRFTLILPYSMMRETSLQILLLVFIEQVFTFSFVNQSEIHIIPKENICTPCQRKDCNVAWSCLCILHPHQLTCKSILLPVSRCFFQCKASV